MLITKKKKKKRKRRRRRREEKKGLGNDVVPLATESHKPFPLPLPINGEIWGRRLFCKNHL